MVQLKIFRFVRDDRPLKLLSFPAKRETFLRVKIWHTLTEPLPGREEIPTVISTQRRSERDAFVENKPADQKHRAASNYSRQHRKQFHAPITRTENLEDQKIGIEVEIGSFYPALNKKRRMAEEIKRPVEKLDGVVEGKYFVGGGAQGKLGLY